MTRVAPKKSLGQHFLVDRNVLGVIERLAHPSRDDVVLEVGPGLGILTTFLADRVRHVHAVELDRSLERPLREALGDRTNVELHLTDALALDIGTLEPSPAKLVANLPYNVATPIVAETLLGAPTIASWCVMVQREVADRFFADPGSKAYGAVSVLVRLHARRTGFHPVARTVFRPPPNVDSALVAFDRIPAPPDAETVRRVVNA
ncbi:MAG TPA: 16S rRNA (adenine(1518)-N(6)/adenine(1519)-N(6))-dimethyltransferase RsmA, partial [Gaiella sp.]|nr:16S rRNA (adenine(1518)-N(6)/adenine(1519)-N(6))-dimethyltransferase RsmA [Gaiella sp.]